MPTDDERRIIETALAKTAEINPQGSDGDWLEVVTAESAPFIRDWDVERAWLWGDWPERGRHFPNTTKLDAGIDVVAVRRGDGEHVAIQCKSRRLDGAGRGSAIGNEEVGKFAAASAGSFWAESWIVANGDISLASGAAQSASMRDKPVKDLFVKSAAVHRCIRQSCGRTFRHCPQGIDRSGQSQRMRVWAALMRALGMSLRSAGDALSAFGESLSHASVRRDVQEAGENARRSLADRAPERASAVGSGETHASVKGKKKVAGVAADARTGQVLGLTNLLGRIQTPSLPGWRIARTNSAWRRLRRTT